MRRLFSLLLVALVVIGLVGCGPSRADEEKSIRAKVDNTFAALQDTAEHDVTTYINEQVVEELATYGVDTNQFFAALLKNLSHTINEITIEDGTAQVAMTVSNVNTDEVMKATLEDFDAWTETDEAVTVYKENGEAGLYQKLFELFYARIDQMAGDAATADVTLNLQKLEDGTWNLAESGNEGFYAAVYGGATFKF